MQSNVGLTLRKTSGLWWWWVGVVDSRGFIHRSPLHIVVDVLGPLQPLSQHGGGVVRVVIRRRPRTQTHTQAEDATLSTRQFEASRIV